MRDLDLEGGPLSNGVASPQLILGLLGWVFLEKS